MREVLASIGLQPARLLGSLISAFIVFRCRVIFDKISKNSILISLKLDLLVPKAWAADAVTSIFSGDAAAVAINTKL